MLYGHGDNIHSGKTKIVSNFSSNVYFKGPSDELLKYLQEGIPFIANYPEVDANELVSKIASHYHLAEESILVTNGAVEAFYLLAQLFKNRTSELFFPCFSEYSDSCTIFDHNINYTPNSQLNSFYRSSSEIIWICNPNNPEGRMLEFDQIISIVTGHPNSFFIVDEAYADFSLKNISVINQISRFNKLIVVRSLTKKYGIPGLRLGFIAAPESIISKLKDIKQPWSVNSMAIRAGMFLFDQAKPEFEVEELIGLSKSLQRKLSEIDGIEVIPSETSFFLIRLNKTARETYDFLLNEHGILVRNASNFKGLDEFYIRLSTQSEKENNILVKVLKQWMKKY